MSATIDINADLGEGYGPWTMGDDEALLGLITTANVACGFHAGDPRTLLETVTRAAAQGVAVGAHPGLPDRQGFGRRAMAIEPRDAYADLVYQIGACRAALDAVGSPLHHVKTHGALYTMLRHDAALAEAVASAIADAGGSGCPVYWPAPATDAFAAAVRRRGLPLVKEFYPDLEYEADGALRIERTKRAVPPRTIAQRVRRFLEDGITSSTDGSPVDVRAESLCVHGDGSNAVEVAAAVRETAVELGFELAPVADTDQGRAA